MYSSSPVRDGGRRHDVPLWRDGIRVTPHNPATLERQSRIVTRNESATEKSPGREGDGRSACPGAHPADGLLRSHAQHRYRGRCGTAARDTRGVLVGRRGTGNVSVRDVGGRRAGREGDLVEHVVRAGSDPVRRPGLTDDRDRGAIPLQHQGGQSGRSGRRGAQRDHVSAGVGHRIAEGSVGGGSQGGDDTHRNDGSASEMGQVASGRVGSGKVGVHRRLQEIDGNEALRRSRDDGRPASGGRCRSDRVLTSARSLLRSRPGRWVRCAAC